MKIPNIITLSRLLFIPLILLTLYSNEPRYLILSIFFFLIAIATDSIDGYIARKFKNQKSKFGTFLDPLVDKMLILSMFFAFSDLGLIPLWLPLIFLFRELLVTCVRQVCSGEKKVVGANWMGKSKFAMQAIVIIYTQFFLLFESLNIITGFLTQSIVFYITLIITTISIVYAINFIWWYKDELLSDL
ncbi:CDP-diacylglycerol--glycerol-3-phosphate 3-phosphatidyltransferase [Nanoarchaeota archaeon]